MFVVRDPPTRAARRHTIRHDTSAQPLLLLLFNTTRTTSGPPSTRASIAMDGGVADTTCYYTGR